MINITQAKKFCKDDISKIENYDKAMADTSQVWVMHHRLETHFSNGDLRPTNARLLMNELKALNMYYDRPADELIFMTDFDHRSLHHKGKINSEETRQKLSKALKGRKHTEETKARMSEKLKGKKHTAEWSRKISESLTGKKASEETRKKLSESHKGKKRKPHTEETKAKIRAARLATLARKAKEG